MQRWLGEKGLEKVCEKLKEKSLTNRLEPLRGKSLKLVNLEKVRSQIIGLFDEIARTSFKTEKDKIKNLNSTTASKVLHLCCPDLFIMWDTDIRYSYGEGKGEDYFQFLIDMKKLWKSLGETIQELQNQYSKKATRIIDEFNWRECHKNQ